MYIFASVENSTKAPTFTVLSDKQKQQSVSIEKGKLIGISSGPSDYTQTCARILMNFFWLWQFKIKWWHQESHFIKTSIYLIMVVFLKSREIWPSHWVYKPNDDQETTPRFIDE